MATQPKLLTYDDYRTLPDDGKQYEIIEGELIMTPSPSMIHQIISRNLFRTIDQHVSKKDLGEVLYAPADVVLSMRDVVQPDLMYISKERLDIIAENNIVEAPDLVIEILSEATAATDRTSKKGLYQQYGTKEYWIVDPTEKAVDQFILDDTQFKFCGQWDQTQRFDSPVLEGFTLAVEKVFSRQ